MDGSSSGGSCSTSSMMQIGLTKPSCCVQSGSAPPRRHLLNHTTSLFRLPTSRRLSGHQTIFCSLLNKWSLTLAAALNQAAFTLGCVGRCHFRLRPRSETPLDETGQLLASLEASRSAPAVKGCFKSPKSPLPVWTWISIEAQKVSAFCTLACTWWGC